MKLIKNILSPVICLAMGYTCVHFYDAGNYDLYMDDISLSIIYGEKTHLDDILKSYNITKEDGVYK